MKTVEHLLEESGLTLEDVAERTGIDLRRIEAIAAGRWTPAPDERRKIALAFNVPIEQISWGHSMDPRNIRYRRFGFRKQRLDERPMPDALPENTRSDTEVFDPDP